MSTTLMENWSGRALRHPVGNRLLVVMMTTVILTALAPLHTVSLPWVTRAAEFAVATLVWEVAIVAARLALGRTDAAAWLPTVTGLILTVLIASVPATTALAVILTVAGERTGAFASLYAQSLLLGLLVAFARRGLRSKSTISVSRKVDQTCAGAGSRRTGSAFLQNRAPKLSGSVLLALEAEDHYLRVHSDRGSELVLLRMRDAIDELGADTGWRPHRSFWLSAEAGGQAGRRGQSWQIVLDSGLTVPVSKASVEAMRSAGYSTSQSLLLLTAKDGCRPNLRFDL